MLRPLVFSLLLVANPALADRDCGRAPPEAMTCCQDHAMAYVLGGSEQDRYQADQSLYYA